jgi:hypothetical protein
MGGEQRTREGPTAHELTRLIGMVVAHYDDLERDAGIPIAKLNTGVAIVLPVERIRALIEGATLTEERKEKVVKSDGEDAIPKLRSE